MTIATLCKHSGLSISQAQSLVQELTKKQALLITTTHPENTTNLTPINHQSESPSLLIKVANWLMNRSRI